MPTNFLPRIILLSLLVMAIGSCKQKEEKKPLSPISAFQLPYEADATYLHRFTTSSNSEKSRFLLDSDTTTFWTPAPGLGEDETVDIWFPFAQKIGSVRVINIWGNEWANIEEIEWYIDGKPGPRGKPGDKIEINRTLSSLELRLHKVAAGTTKRFFDPINRTEITTRTPGPKAPAISEIELFDFSGDPIKVRPVPAFPGKLAASSYQNSELAPAHLFDSRLDFGWTEGSQGNGLGEKLVFEFDEPIKIDKMMVWNRTTRPGETGDENSRVMSLTFGRTDHLQGIYRLRDEAQPQQFMLEEPLHEKTFSMTLNQFYPGTETEKISLAEIRFYDGKRWFSMAPHSQKQADSTTRAKVSGTFLQKWLDRPWSITRQNIGSETSERMTVVLRTNGTFSLYFNKENGADFRNMRFAQGYWHFLNQGKEQAKLALSGTLYSGKYDPNKAPGIEPPTESLFFSSEAVFTPGYATATDLFDTVFARPQPRLLQFVDETTGPFVRDIRYATATNFLNENVYGDCDICLLKQETADSLTAAATELAAKGYKIKIFDCYRPLDVQRKMWALVDDPRYVANPDDGGSVHNRGYAVDISLVHADGRPVDMGTDFDHFGEEAHHDYRSLDEQVLANRKLLRNAMETHGFRALETEWWHYNHIAGDSARPMNYWPCK